MPRPPGAPWWQDDDHVEANWNPEDTHTPPANVELTDEWADAINDAYEAILALMPNTTEEPASVSWLQDEVPRDGRGTACVDPRRDWRAAMSIAQHRFNNDLRYRDDRADRQEPSNG